MLETTVDASGAVEVADNTVRTVRVRMPRATGAAGSAEPVERHGEGLHAPAGAQVIYHDDDPDCGPMLKYVTVQPQ